MGGPTGTDSLTDKQTDHKWADGRMYRETYRQIRLGIYDKEQFVKSALTNCLYKLINTFYLQIFFGA
jgi:hypothetical protein